MKYEWKKIEKDLYIPKDTPAIVTVPKQKFFTIKGKVTQMVRISPREQAFCIPLLMLCV